MHVHSTLSSLSSPLVMYGYPMQSNEVKSSYHMDKEGLIRAIDLLKKKRFQNWCTCNGLPHVNCKVVEGQLTSN